MAPHDELFQERTLDAQLDALANGDGEAVPATPVSRTYHALAELYAPAAAREAESIERVRQRLASRVGVAATGTAHPRHEQRQMTPPARFATLPSYQPRHARPRARLRAFVSGAAALLAVGCLLSGFLVALQIRQATPVSPGFTWRVVPSPNTAQAVNNLMGITVRTSSDAWAWGESNLAPTSGSGVSSNPIHQPLFEHWDGHQWRIVASPPTPEGGDLSAFAAVAADDAWTIGSQITGGPENTGGAPLIEHWDGHTWTIQPNQLSGGLNGLAALSADDIWAVGSSGDPAGASGLIAHWDGHAWRTVSHPVPASGVEFSAIAAVSPDDIWVVGRGAGGGQGMLAVFEHWDGQQWRLVPSAPLPSLGPLSAKLLHTGTCQISTISAVSANDVWVAGFEVPLIPIPNFQVPLFEHWDGHTWSVVSSPSVSAQVSDIVALGPNDVWAVGMSGGGLDTAQIGQGLVEHWDGQQWSLIANPNPRGFTSLAGIARDPTTPGKIWIAGITGPSTGRGDQLGDTRTLIETNQ